ncbi:MAG: YcaQ family DNA glycosylase [Thermoleophilia bacterium]|nr:YcaQ family DNA glycosylase [Thermoleophilia bacterium]
MEAAIARLSCVQLDSITAVERSHRIVLGSRVGVYPRGTVSRLLVEGRVFEYWAHEACLVPIDDFALFKRRMQSRRMHHWYGPVVDSEPELAARVLAEIRERGPLGSRDFEGAGGGLWQWKPAKRMLEALWTAGELVVSGRRGFERLYELPERVIPREQLDAPAPSEDEYLRGLVVRAVTARGALTERAIADHYRVAGGIRRIRPALAALLAEGRLATVPVADGGPALVVAPGADLEPEAPAEAVLLSPFDNLLWDRELVERLFAFRHRIEVYKPPHEREFGYYVLPFLRGDRLVGRADLKTDRRAGQLRVVALHLERGVRESGALRRSFEGALARLAGVVGVGTIETPWTSRPARSMRARSRIPPRAR